MNVFVKSNGLCQTHCHDEKMHFYINAKGAIAPFTYPLIFFLTCPPVRLPIFCNLFSEDFNIMSARFIHQSFTLPQKNDSREGFVLMQIGVSL